MYHIHRPCRTLKLTIENNDNFERIASKFFQSINLLKAKKIIKMLPCDQFVLARNTTFHDPSSATEGIEEGNN